MLVPFAGQLRFEYRAQDGVVADAGVKGIDQLDDGGRGNGRGGHDVVLVILRKHHSIKDASEMQVISAIIYRKDL
jgi:hypothetical protein